MASKPKAALGVFLDLFFPPKCIFCQKLLKKGESGICAHCLQELPRTKGQQALQSGSFFTACVSPLYYAGTVRTSFHRYKFKGMSQYAGQYGALIAEAVREHLAGQYDLITWVPLSRERKRKRGYDQAMLLAMATAVRLEDVAVETLVKRVNTKAQTEIGKADARRANVLGAYEVSEAELVTGKRILLIDDIITTGSTISECARVLREAGASEVFCATLARNEQDVLDLIAGS